MRPEAAVIDPAVQLAIRAALALLFAAAAAHKLRDLAAFRATFAEYRILPGALAVLVPPAELAVAALLPLPGAAGALGAAALLAVYAAAVAANLARGRRDIDCGCAGPTTRRPIGPSLVARNALLAAAALATLLPASPRPLAWLDAVTVAGGVLALAAMYLAADRLMAQEPPLARLREAA